MSWGRRWHGWRRGVAYNNQPVRPPMIEVQNLTKHYGPLTAIPDMQDRLIRNLSKGYRQRVGLAQALVSDPAVLILDEPTIGLDPAQIAEVRALIKSLAGEHTVILSTHILPEVSMVCGSVVIINRGAIVAQGPIDRLVEQFFPTARVEVGLSVARGVVRDGMRA